MAAELNSMPIPSNPNHLIIGDERAMNLTGFPGYEVLTFVCEIAGGRPLGAFVESDVKVQGMEDNGRQIHLSEHYDFGGNMRSDELGLIMEELHLFKGHEGSRTIRYFYVIEEQPDTTE